MVFRDRQGPSPQPSADPLPTGNNRDRYLDNCFLLCVNRNDELELPEIHRLEDSLMRDLCDKGPRRHVRSQQQSRLYPEDQRDEQDYELDDDDDDYRAQRAPTDHSYPRRRRQERDTPTVNNRSRYYRDATTDNYQYSRTGRYPPPNDYNIMQHSDDELSVYEVYVPTNTLNRLSDKRTENNMVLIDYDDGSMMQQVSSPYGYPPRPMTSHYDPYRPVTPQNDPRSQYPYDSSAAFGRDRSCPPPMYSNMPSPSMRGYYGNNIDPQAYPAQPGPFMPGSMPMNHSNAISVRRHLYSSSQLPQGLTEGQLVMLLQKGSQNQTGRSQPPAQPDLQPPPTATVTIAHQTSPAPSARPEPFQNSDYAATPQFSLPPAVPQIVDHRPTNDERPSLTNSTAEPPHTLTPAYTAKPPRDIESKGSDEKKKEKSGDGKKEKHGDRDAADHHKKDSKKEKSSGKDGKKKKK